MGGTVLFQDALHARLELIKPSSQDITALLAKHPIRFSQGIEALITQLQARGIHVFLVSGGFRQMINPIAEKLGIPSHRVYANTLLFDDVGAYAGFDSSEFTSRDGGKPAVITRLKELHRYKTVIMVGDGATDMQARPPADAFIGYGGVIERENIRRGADWYVKDFNEMTSVFAELK
jgi:phosphoserine phosphatase